MDHLSDLCHHSVSQLSRLIRRKKVSPTEVIKAHLDRIGTLDSKLNSFITILFDEAMEAARRAEREIQGGKYRGPLHGIPGALKDLCYVKGIPSTSGTKIFDKFIPKFDSTIASKLKKEGVIFLGKLNLHQLAYGTTGENPDYGDTHNPWNPDFVTGGSSGGCGSATASGQCALSIGTDTGGSIRIPGALCGLVGFKPTYGRISRYGITMISWSQDHVGPMTRTVEDCALVMNAISGYDSNDPFSSKKPVPDYTKALTEKIRGLRIGIPKEFFKEAIDTEIDHSVREAFETLGHLGAAVVEVSWPMYSQARAISNTIVMVEATAYHSNLIRTHGSKLSSPVRLNLEAGFFISGFDYVQAQRARRLLYDQSYDLLNKVDLLAGPTVPITAFEIGTRRIKLGRKSIGVIPALPQYTQVFNLIGFPAITIPCGFSKIGLPIGLQFAGRPFDEETVLRAAYAFEQATEWHNRRPAI